MAKNLIPNPILAHLSQLWGSKTFRGLYLYQMLDIVASCIQFQEKLMIQTQVNGKKPHFGPDLGPLNPNLGCQFFFSKI